MRKLLLIFGLNIILILTIPMIALAGTGPGARAAAMGGAYSALADDASGFFWNPAGMAQLQNYVPFFDLGMSSQLFNAIFNDNIDNYLMNIVYKSQNRLYLSWEYAGLGLGFSSPHLGINLYSQNVLVIAAASFIEETGCAYVQPEYARIDSLTYTCAGKFSPSLNWGININTQDRNWYKIAAAYAPGNIDVISAALTAYGCSADFGLLYHPNNHWSFSLVAKDLLSQFSYNVSVENLSLKQTLLWQDDGQKAAIPYYITGFAYQQPDWRFTAAGDYKYRSGGNRGNLSLGVEEGLFHWLYFRAGYSRDDNSPNALYSCGFGIKAGKFTADLAGMTLFQKWNAMMTVSCRF